MNLTDIIESLPKRCYRGEVEPKTIQLEKAIASALGTSKRQSIPILKPILSAVSNKLAIKGITSGNTDIDLFAAQWLLETEELQQTIFRNVVRDGETYVLINVVDGVAKYTNIEAYNGSTGAAYIYGDNDTVEYALHIWQDNKVYYCDVYFIDRIEQYRFNNKEWEQYNTIEWNAALGLPLIKFDIGTSDIADAIQLNKDINEAILDLIAVSRTMGFPQRYTTGKLNAELILNSYGQALIDPIVNRPLTRNLTLQPGGILNFSEGTTLGQLDAATADTSVIDKLLHLLTIVTTVPMHYFTGNWPSGIALLNAEMRLNHKVESHQMLLVTGVSALLETTIRLRNEYGGT